MDIHWSQRRKPGKTGKKNVFFYSAASLKEKFTQARRETTSLCPRGLNLKKKKKKASLSSKANTHSFLHENGAEQRYSGQDLFE